MGSFPTVLQLQKCSALIIPNSGPAKTQHSLSALVLLLRSAGGCAQRVLASVAPGRFKMQITHLCSTAQDNSYSTTEPGQGSTRKCLQRWEDYGALDNAGHPKAVLWWRSPIIQVAKQKVFSRQQGTTQHMIREGGKMIYHLVLLERSLISTWKRWHTHTNTYIRRGKDSMGWQFKFTKDKKKTG